MKKFKEKILSGSAGAAGGLAGLTAVSRCSGGDCSACFGCAAVGLTVIIFAFIKGFNKKKEKKNGLFQRIN